MISLIAAFDSNLLIGKDNKLPWHYSEDILFFKEQTFQKEVLVGSKTYFSLMGYYKKKKLPFKTIYIANSKFDPNINIDNLKEKIILINDLILFLKKKCEEKKEIIVIGGSQIYQQSLPFVNKMIITHILRRYQGNKFFPIFDYNDFTIKKKKISNELIFVTYIRK
ncbi:MAG: dihydrofolate reductase [Candidatus Phytoplasma cynodontis]|uniref:dihydrofolate reductase n=1 Tax='Cynodon dactylon' phytoplasma TaxID=295320 RepID=UPI001265B3EF|nr:dihydrofolate reductase ['Cynodon dactylon' phytoplasma]KAB8121930.1 dihydrofolate reductase ['Cynodon dactylon' phytoplasma]WIA07661.1 MAG: dihydrofolate reductase [Candidatus Phytoplasma cynodontis]